MNFKTTIVLLILLVAGGAVLYFTNSQSKPAAPQISPTGGTKVFDLETAHVNRVNIIDAAGKQTSLLKSGDQWRLSSPANALASKYAVQDFISGLVNLESTGTPSDVNAAETGLDKPRYQIEIDTDNGKHVAFKIGQTNAIGDRSYAQVDGSKEIQLIPASLNSSLKDAATSLRDKTLLAISDDQQLRQIHLDSTSGAVALVKNGEKWNLVAPMQVAADDLAISSLTSAISGLSATEFVDADSPEALVAFRQPGLRVWISTATPPPASAQPASKPATKPDEPIGAATTMPSESAGGLSLTFGASDGLDHYFVKTSDGVIAKVDKFSYDDLNKTALDLRTKDVARVAQGDVSRIAISIEPFAGAATRPSTRPSSAPMRPASSIVLVRRKIHETIGPPLPALPARAPATRSSSTTQPAPKLAPAATQPAKPESIWEIQGKPDIQVDDGKVTALLAMFDPLHVDKFLNRSRGVVAETYKVDLITSGASPVTRHFEFREPGVVAIQPDGTYQGAYFEVPRSLLNACAADFEKK